MLYKAFLDIFPQTKLTWDGETLRFFENSLSFYQNWTNKEKKLVFSWNILMVFLNQICLIFWEKLLEFFSGSALSSFRNSRSLCKAQFVTATKLAFFTMKGILSNLRVILWPPRQSVPHLYRSLWLECVQLKRKLWPKDYKIFHSTLWRYTPYFL